MSYLDKNGNYYEGDKQYGDIDVPKRPSAEHEYVNGEWVLPQSSIDDIKQKMIARVQLHLDTDAKLLGYDNILSACSYAAGTTSNKYKTEGISFLNWRSNVWDHCYQVLADVQAQLIPIPTEAELIQGLPVRV